MSEFSYHHPKAYRRLLVAGCACMLAGGLISSATARQSSGHGFSFSELALAIPAPTASAEPAAVPMTRLPGSDGTAAAPAKPAALPVPAAAALTVNGDVRGLGRIMNTAAFGDAQWGALDSLWTRESNWSPSSRNRYSGACGIPQALPCSKITDMSAQGQITWGLSYIKNRYGTPDAAWSHEEHYGWY